jgi:glycosyltransferase involved in cell wall biosynthesis
MSNLVSILIPAFNAEEWIAETIRSALNQTWPEKEIIVVDDGSRDNTLTIAKTFESNKVKVTTQKNAGACATRNRALSLAQGDHIQWLDADDLLDPEKIFLQLSESDGGASSRVLLTCSWGKFFFRHTKAKFRPDSLWHNLEPVEWIIRKFTDNVWMNPAVWLVSRRLTELAGPWDERLSISGDDDGEYICRVVAASEKVMYVPESRCYYRIGNSGSLDAGMGKSKEKLESLLMSLRLSIEHLLSLENSQRTRAACVKHLQTWLPLYYPERKELLSEIKTLAEGLGGKVQPPKVSWKYSAIKRVFGWTTAKKAMSTWQKSKLVCQRDVDWLLHNFMQERHNGVREKQGPTGREGRCNT